MPVNDPNKHSNCSLDIQTVVHPYTENISNMRIWREFTAGISIFKQGMNRINADLTGIARSNLHLLHHDFMRSKNYLYLLNDLKIRGTKSWITLATGPNLNCSLLTIPPHQIETIADTITRIPDFNVDITHNKYILMLYVVTGKVTVRYKNRFDTMPFGYLNLKETDQLLKPTQACMQSSYEVINALQTQEDISQILVVIATAAQAQFHTHL